uniref:Uncharacterized protein n=1 Tax=Arundo donax TaxID=35708 RepID=A0A0A9FBR0_ARUDO
MRSQRPRRRPSPATRCGRRHELPIRSPLSIWANGRGERE